MEQWKAIAGYEGLYEVSDLGRVKSLNYSHTHKEKILRPVKGRKGYLQVSLYKDGQIKNWRVHRLVAEAFIPNPQCMETINHRDEVKTNNSASNLEWMSQKDNTNYGTRNKRIAEARLNHPAFSKKVQMFDKSTGELLATFPSTMEAERITGIANQSISACCKGKYKSSGGYIWRYA